MVKIFFVFIELKKMSKICTSRSEYPFKNRVKKNLIFLNSNTLVLIYYAGLIGKGEGVGYKKLTWTSA